ESGQAPAVEPRLTPAADALLGTDVPVIAAVNGAAVGWGMELALMADIRVASERARFGELFVLRGLCTDVAGIGRLAQVVGRERAAELLFTGDVIDAATALEIGLVSRVVPHDDLLPVAVGLAQRVAANPPLAVRRIKAGLRRALDPDWHELGAWVSASLAELFSTDDHREGVKAFLEKRLPRYTGRCSASCEPCVGIHALPLPALDGDDGEPACGLPAGRVGVAEDSVRGEVGDLVQRCDHGGAGVCGTGCLDRVDAELRRAPPDDREEVERLARAARFVEVVERAHRRAAALDDVVAE